MNVFSTASSLIRCAFSAVIPSPEDFSELIRMFDEVDDNLDDVDDDFEKQIELILGQNDIYFKELFPLFLISQKQNQD